MLSSLSLLLCMVCPSRANIDQAVEYLLCDGAVASAPDQLRRTKSLRRGCAGKKRLCMKTGEARWQGCIQM
jgi:hypothetical protein